MRLGTAVPGEIGRVETQFFSFGSVDDPVTLRSGESLPGVTLAYETYGELNAERSNAVLVFHALTGSHHAAGYNPEIPEVGARWTEEYHQGWWDGFIGPGKAIDTDRYFVLCVNYLAGCYGTTGPSSLDPRTGRPFGSSFPRVSFADMVDVHLPLLNHLGIEKLHAVTGGSTGGLMAVSLSTRYPELVDIVIPIAAGVETTSLQRIHNYEQITAIETDPNFNGGDYYGGEPPNRGLALARMIGHKTFVSLRDLRLRARDEVMATKSASGYQMKHALESYMAHQGEKFIARFDANSYLRIMEAWQTVDLVHEAERDDLADLFIDCKHQRYLLFSIDSDVCFYPEEQEEMARYLELADVPYRWITVHSDKGHDSFLLEPELFSPHLTHTLAGGW